MIGDIGICTEQDFRKLYELPDSLPDDFFKLCLENVPMARKIIDGKLTIQRTNGST